MKKLLMSALLLAAGAAQAATFTDYATVVKSEPLYGPANQNGCVPSAATQAPGGDAGGLGGLVTAENGGTLLGGIVGGVLGNQVGGGRGQTAATIVGAIGGAMAGRQIARSVPGAAPAGQAGTVCPPAQQVLTGYLVTYEYRGQRETVTLPYQPGKQLKMTVSAQPAID